MTKAILLIFVLLVAYWFYRNRRNDPGGKVNKSEHRAEGQSENIVVCAYCRLHIPESEAVADSGRFFCSDEHRRLSSS